MRLAPGSKGACRLRDTLKVTGSPASLGIIFVNEEQPTGGGTGHTIKVCGRQGVPVAVQSKRSGWMAA